MAEPLLEAGDAAPPLDLCDQHGNAVSLKALGGR